MAAVFSPFVLLFAILNISEQRKKRSGKDWGGRSWDRGCTERFSLREPWRAVLCTAPSTSAEAPGKTCSLLKWVFFKSFFPMTFVIAGAKKRKDFPGTFGLWRGQTQLSHTLQPSLREGRRDNLPTSLTYMLVKAQAILAKHLRLCLWVLVSETGHLKLEMNLNKERPFRRWYVWTEQGKHLALPGETNALAS